MQNQLAHIERQKYNLHRRKWINKKGSLNINIAKRNGKLFWRTETRFLAISRHK